MVGMADYPTDGRGTPALSPASPAAVSPLGSVFTSIVLAAASALVGWLVHSGIITQADVGTVTAVAVSGITAAALMVYKALSHTQDAKITAVAALPGVTVVAPSPIANGPEHGDDPGVISPATAAEKFAPKRI